METKILANIDNPHELEKLYQSNKANFKKEMNALYPSLKAQPLVQFWYERLNFEKEGIALGSVTDILYVVLGSLAAGTIAKIPYFFELNFFNFYSRHIAFIIVPILSFYFLFKSKATSAQTFLVLALQVFAAMYINAVPFEVNGSTLALSCIYMPFFLWSVLGFSYTASHLNNYRERLYFLRYNGDLLIITGLILIAGMILTAVTVGLFSLIGLEIFDFYFRNIVIVGLAASPVVGTYIIEKNPELVNKVSPVIAKIFSPLVLITLVVYLVAIFIERKNPYSDRGFLLTFNFLLIGVMAIILFSVVETARDSENKAGQVILVLLALVTIIINVIALSAIVFRISEWGVSPNRMAVLGSNLLILSNLLLVTVKLFKAIINKSNTVEEVEKSIATFLPVYSVWALVVTFFFPLLFGFK